MNDKGSLDWQSLLPILTDLMLTWGVRVLGALAVLVIGRVVAGMARRAVRRLLQRSSVDDTLIPFVSSLVYYLLLAFVLIAVLGLFGIPTASFIAVLGAAGLAVGLALQGTLSNFASGVMLLLFRPFRAGDFVEAGGASGTVAEIGIFNTSLNTPDNIRVIIPNSAIFGQTIKNFAANDTRRNDMTLGIGYDDDIDTAMAVIRKALEEDERVLPEPEPVIAVGELADSSVNLVIRPWCKRQDYWALRWDLTRRLKVELEAAGCSIPYPQRDVHLFQEASGQAG